jgi:hypothetical protein
MSRNHMNRRKGELTGARIDREWPYQVALPAEQVAGKNYVVAHDFCRDLSLCPRGHAGRREGIEYHGFCFANPAHADLFRDKFMGERFDPKDRGQGANWHLWRQK